MKRTLPARLVVALSGLFCYGFGRMRYRLKRSGMPRLSPTQVAIIAETVATLLPRRPHLSAAARQRVAAATTAFVAGQVESLPSFLGVPYRVALTAFDLLPVLRHGRPFRFLDAPDKAAHLASWDCGRLAAFRNFVKLIRSCALLAYYDHPDVLEALRAQEPAPVPAPQLAVS